jgi:hypothetical protein
MPVKNFRREKMQEIKVNSSVLRCDDSDIKDMSDLTIGSPVVVFAKGYSDWSICPGIVTGFADNGSDLSAIAVTIYKDDKILTVPITDETKDKYLLAKTASMGMLISKESMLEKLYSAKHEQELKLEKIISEIKFFENFTKLT